MHINVEDKLKNYGSALLTILSLPKYDWSNLRKWALVIHAAAGYERHQKWGSNIQGFKSLLSDNHSDNADGYCNGMSSDSDWKTGTRETR